MGRYDLIISDPEYSPSSGAQLYTARSDLVMRRLEAGHRVASPAEHERGGPTAFGILRALEQLIGRGAAQPGVEAAVLHATARDASFVHPERVERQRLTAHVVERGGQPVSLDFYPFDDEGRVLHLHRHPHRTDLQVVSLDVDAEVVAQVGKDTGMRDLGIVVKPRAVPVDAQARQRPGRRVGSRRGCHGKRTAQKVTAPSGSGHWRYSIRRPGASGRIRSIA